MSCLHSDVGMPENVGVLIWTMLAQHKLVVAVSLHDVHSSPADRYVVMAEHKCHSVSPKAGGRFTVSGSERRKRSIHLQHFRDDLMAMALPARERRSPDSLY